MTYRIRPPAPVSGIAEEKRGPVVGRFCRSCRYVYPLYAARHKGKPAYGKDHVASTCAHEGELFSAGADWWEPAVEALPVPAAAS